MCELKIGIIYVFKDNLLDKIIIRFFLGFLYNILKYVKKNIFCFWKKVRKIKMNIGDVVFLLEVFYLL